MKEKSKIKSFAKELYEATLNSYSVIFFTDNKFLAATLLLVSFLNFWAGISGLLSVLFVILIGKSMHLHQSSLSSGYYSFNALLAGWGMGTFFDPSFVFFSLLALTSLLTLLLSVSLGAWLYKYKLPYLSIPFVITFWFIVLPSSHFENLGLTQRSIFWINEMYALGGNELLDFIKSINSFSIHHLVDIYLRSLSSILFQNNIITGLLISIALLISSRIFFSLSIIGFLSAYFFAQFTGSEAASINYYNIGANYMMVAFAIGGFFTIPSRQSYLWTVLLIPLTSLVLLFFYKLLGYIQLPVFSLPFSVVSILFIYFLQQRTKSKNLILTPLQLNSPEKNLYTYKNNLERLSGLYYFPFQLPFLGEWTVTQAHKGEYTHKDEWQHAFDFMITDENGQSFRNAGLQLSDYYCYNKPVFAPANGFIEIISDNIDDNDPGNVDTVNNWGNSIIIRHLNGLYTQISHLKKGSFKVQQGAFVHKGDILAHCGNSGRSPEPHIHFQVQIYPTIGAKTIDYPFAYFNKSIDAKNTKLMQFQKPEKGDKISPVSTDNFIFNAFNFLPDKTLNINYTLNNSELKTEQWETYTDAYNQKYFYCAETESTAYYVNDGTMFYFTAFYGNKKSVLYYFYLSAYKIFLGEKQAEDHLPLNVLKIPVLLTWLQDFLAPFYNFILIKYNSKIQISENALNSGYLKISSEVNLNLPRKQKQFSFSNLTITNKGLSDFEFSTKNCQVKATCSNI